MNCMYCKGPTFQVGHSEWLNCEKCKVLLYLYGEYLYRVMFMVDKDIGKYFIDIHIDDNETYIRLSKKEPSEEEDWEEMISGVPPTIHYFKPMLNNITPENAEEKLDKILLFL